MMFAQARSRPFEAVRRPDVDDLGARRHRVHGLDVEGLLAVPALRSAQVLGVVAVRLRGDLRVLARLEQRLAVHLVVLLRVLEHRRRGVGVGDGHGDPAPVDALLDQRALPVRRLELRRGVTAHRVGLVLAVGSRLVGGDLLPVVRRARLDPEPAARRRARQRVGGLLQLGALVDPDDPADRAADRGRGAGRQGQLAGVRVDLLAQVRVVVDLRPEGGLHLADRPADRDVHPAGQSLGDLEALVAEPVPHRGDRGRGRGVLGVELLVRQVMAVAGAGRVGYRLQGGLGAGCVPHAQQDAEGRWVGRHGGAHVAGERQPLRRTAGERVPGLRRGRGGSGGHREAHGGRSGQQSDGNFASKTRRAHTQAPLIRRKLTKTNGC